MPTNSLSLLSDRMQDLAVLETRSQTDAYVELVFLNEHQAAWDALLQEVFGSAVKEAPQRPSRAHRALTRAHGGINKGQTLYRTDADGTQVLAMLWPWQNGTHTTLKIFTAAAS